MSRLWILSAVCAGLCVAAPAAAQVSAACKPVSDAMLKAVTTPHHLTSKMTGRDEPGETIVTGDTTYVKSKGTWRKSPMSPADQLKQENENIKNAKVYTCQSLRTEVVNGVSTTVYKVHTVNDSSTGDGMVWVAPSLGLPVRSEQDIDAGDGMKMHMVATWDYANIKAPIVK
jgi:hypothetical protein